MAGSGHIGGSLSSMDILTVLYYKYMNIKKDDPTWADRDRFILSKGHIGIGYAGLLCDLGWNDPEQLKTFNLTNSKMGVHLDSNKVVGVDASTGSLGHGLSIAVGTALAARVQKNPTSPIACWATASATKALTGKQLCPPASSTPRT